eukprot:NODE_6_length_70510_cov_1.054395.p47 type:complete len:196 gc:universal NODE_6_length_70510_cov_1.054395:58452-57865(-)
MFPLQSKIDTINALNSKLDLLLQSQLYSMPLKGHRELLKWQIKDKTLNITCTHLSAYITRMEIIYADEKVTYEPTESHPKSVFNCQRPSRPSSLVLELNSGTLVQPIGELKKFMEIVVGSDVAFNLAYIESIIIQYATLHKIFHDNIIQCDSMLKKIFKRDSLTLDVLDEKISTLTKSIDKVVIDLKEDTGGNFQ